MSPRIKHVSFDVWKTLIEPNPEFGTARKRVLEEAFDLPPEVVEAAYRKVKDGADAEAEINGVGYTSAQVYERLLTALDRPTTDWWGLRMEFERLFELHPPVVLPSVIDTLRTLQMEGFGLSIASNTNFIQGTCLSRAALDRWDVHWTFKVFSDQLGVAKPSPMLWHAVQAQARILSDAAPAQILHVGDNKVCDGGCRDFGIQFLHINGPADLAEAISGIIAHAQAA